jgi:hypothetical protein
MKSIVSSIQGSEKLTAIFGDWPSFHDAEIVELNLTRKEARPEKAYRSPSLTLKIHLWAMTKELDEKGYFIFVTALLPH